MNSVEWEAEEYFIELLRTLPEVNGKPFRHFDDDNESETECITIRAEADERQLEGPMANRLNITVEYRAPSDIPKQQLDQVQSALRTRITNARGGMTSAEEKFAAPPGILQIYAEEMSETRENTNTLRVRLITVPILARLVTE